jgi:uracil-DNA glycosylase
MQHHCVKQNPVGYRLRGTQLYYNPDTTNQSWRACTRCVLQYGRRRVCLRYDGIRTYRNESPTRILFIGEAPGATENITGVPFSGHSGRILTQIFDYTKTAFTILITNTVCCQPKTAILPDFGKIDSIEQFDKLETETHKLEFIDHNRNPTPSEMKACSNHITELELEYRPQGIVFLGQIAQRAKTITPCPKLNLLHPAAIAREEYKVIPMKKEAHKLEQFIKSIRAGIE